MRDHRHSRQVSFEVALHNPSGRAALQRILLGRVDVSLVFSGEGEADALARVRNGIARLIEGPLATAKVSSLAGDDTLEALGQWIGGRLTRCYGLWARVDRVELAYRGRSEPAASYIAPAARAAPGPSFARALTRAAPDDDAAARYLAQLLEAELTAPYGGGHRFTRRHDVAEARQLLRNATAEHPVRFCTLVCPPYLKLHDDGAHREYVGLASEFTATPAGYHRPYDYLQYFGSLGAMTAAARSNGLAIAPTIVFADWGLVGMDGLRESHRTDAEVLDSLASFCESMRRHAAHDWPEIVVTSYRDLGLSPLMPLGLPIGDGERIAWLRQVSRDRALDRDTDVVDACLGVVDRDDTLGEIEHWRSYESFVGRHGSTAARGHLYDILKMYSNIVWIRKREAAAAGDAVSKAAELRRAAMIDALVRWVQYGLYADAIAARLSPAVIVYQDDGFTACGNALRLPGLPVLFIDPARALDVFSLRGTR